MASAGGKAKILVEVTSDTVCPWCYVGKRRLERAMARLATAADFTVRWLPFQLNPGAPREGQPKLEVYNQKFGAARVAQMLPAMTRTFAEEGLDYQMGGLTGNTMDSHRLIAWSEQFGAAAQNALVEQLFSGYFCQEKYIGDREFLLSAAATAGLPAEGAAAVLDDPRVCADQVAAHLATAVGINGVPSFVINKSTQLSGAQQPETFEQVFRSICQQQQQQQQ